MTYIAIVKSQNNKIAKYAIFDTQKEAESHKEQYGGFVFNNINEVPINYVIVDWNNQTATTMTQEEIDDQLAPERKMGINRERDRRIDIPKSVSLTSVVISILFSWATLSKASLKSKKPWYSMAVFTSISLNPSSV